jgi:NAD-dependent DNA ligase
MTTGHNYTRFTQRMNLDKAVHTLEGILIGISIDDNITEPELRELRRWRSEHIEYSRRHPFNEIMPKVDAAMADGILTVEEKEDLLWLCKNLRTDSIYYNELTSDLQRLQGILHGVLADGILTDEEILKLSDWITENEHLKGCYPFDEIDSVLTSILADGQIDEDERSMLKNFLEDFVVIGEVPKEKIGTRHLAVSGVCAVCPEIIFAEKSFCLTGESRRATRVAIAEKIESIGGKVIGNVREDLDYLIICAAGNYCWAFSCFGRKVERAVKYRKKGAMLTIAHENDLWDAIADNSY